MNPTTPRNPLREPADDAERAADAAFARQPGAFVTIPGPPAIAPPYYALEVTSGDETLRYEAPTAEDLIRLVGLHHAAEAQANV